jgi:hypothetical protein
MRRVALVCLLATRTVGAITWAGSAGPADDLWEWTQQSSEPLAQQPVAQPVSSIADQAFWWGTDGSEDLCVSDCQFPGVPDEPMACYSFTPWCCLD